MDILDSDPVSTDLESGSVRVEPHDHRITLVCRRFHFDPYPRTCFVNKMDPDPVFSV